MTAVSLATIGFTRTSAEDFFRRLVNAGVTTVVDVRLNNTSQLAGFAKARDLAYFLDAIGGIGYRHDPMLAPTPEMLADYRKKKTPWDVYAPRFLALMADRRIEDRVTPRALDHACLLCSEASPDTCHRRLVAEYLRDRWRDPLVITHL